jgi:hypothetical protein
MEILNNVKPDPTLPNIMFKKYATISYYSDTTENDEKFVVLSGIRNLPVSRKHHQRYEKRL